MRFPDIRSVEQTEQKNRRIRVCLEEKQMTVVVGLFFFIKAPTNKITKLQFHRSFHVISSSTFKRLFYMLHAHGYSLDYIFQKNQVFKDFFERHHF